LNQRERNLETTRRPDTSIGGPFRAKVRPEPRQCWCFTRKPTSQFLARTWRAPMSRQLRERICAICVWLALIALPAAAATFPDRPIRWVIAGPAGGSLDVIARSMQESLRTSLGQPIVIDNRAGAGGTIAANEVAKSAPDGQTWLMGFNGPLAFAPHLYRNLPYQPLRDLQPVALTTAQPNLIAVSSKFPASNLRELVDALRASPGKYAYASVGNGSSSHLTMEYLKALTGTSILHVPFNGGGLPAIQAIVSGDAHILATVPTTLMPQIAAGTMKAIAVTGASRYALLPDVPTMAESGVRELRSFESTAWNGVLVAAHTPRAVVERINRALNGALNDPQVRARLKAAGLEPVGGTPEQFGKRIADESAKWAPVIKSTGATLD
jgi:tripartite-type tricarboxylate transporter receptor subunit TctC